MIRAIIIDDEEHCINRLQELIRLYCASTVRLEGSYQSVEDGVNAINTLQPDLIFLDIQIKEKTGFDLLRQLKNINSEVIFTTAFEQYAIQAFKFSAIDYLLKPVDKDDLLQAVNKLTGKMLSQQSKQKLDVLLSNLQSINDQTKKIAIPTINGLLFVPVTEIIRCESSINYTTLFLQDKQKITVAKTLKEFEELLTPHKFFRVHNSHLINLAHIKEYRKGKGGFVFMEDNTEIEVSTRRKEDFLKILAEL
jgi:two-component system, LytTR family, response regulator